MLKMFYEIQEYYKYLISAYPTELDGRIYEDPAQPKMWPINILQRWENYCEEALTLIEKHKSTNLSLYNSLYKNIVLESIFPQYVILELHRGKFSSSQINERVKKLLADCQLTKISRYGEGKPLIPAINAWISE